jgi:glucose/arabinose dehydrogenase
MKKNIIIIIVVIFAVAIYFALGSGGFKKIGSSSETVQTPETSQKYQTSETTNSSQSPQTTGTALSLGLGDVLSDASKKPFVVASSLEIPWDIVFLPDGDFLVTERPGYLTRISKNGVKKTISVPGVKHSSEGGLLGAALHPDFSANNFLYLYYGVAGQGGQTKNQVVRYEFVDNSLRNPKTIIENIPGAIYHDGGRIEFGPDGFLYIATGDATDSRLAQNLESLAGKILRITDEGAIPADNPFGTAVYSYGHRNPQGLAWDVEGKLWSTEHGRSGVLSGFDELNLIQPGKNYGWPEIQGDETKEGMVAPVLHSGANETWAPASLIYKNGKLYFGGLRGEGVYEVTLEGEKVSGLKKYFDGEFGRIRTVRIGPDNIFYFTTSNRDARGQVRNLDDKIVGIMLQ